MFVMHVSVELINLELTKHPRSGIQYLNVVFESLSKSII